MKDDFEMQDERIISGLQEENTKLRSDISHLNAEIASLNEQLSHMRMMLDEAEAANCHEKLREAIQAERKRWAKEDAEALRVRDIEQQRIGVESVIDAAIDMGLIENDRQECDAVRDKAKQLSKELEK